MSIPSRFVSSSGLLVQLWLLIAFAACANAAPTSNGFASSIKSHAFVNQRTVASQMLKNVDSFDRITLVDDEASTGQDDGESAEDNQVRSAVQYGDEIEALRYSESAYLQRNKHHHMESLIVPASTTRNIVSGYNEPIIV